MDLMESSESQHVIGIYNILAKTLIEYEVVWTASWFKDIHKVKVGLEQPLIIQDWKTGPTDESSLPFAKLNIQ